MSRKKRSKQRRKSHWCGAGEEVDVIDVYLHGAVELKASGHAAVHTQDDLAEYLPAPRRKGEGEGNGVVGAKGGVEEREGAGGGGRARDRRVGSANHMRLGLLRGAGFPVPSRRHVIVLCWEGAPTDRKGGGGGGRRGGGVEGVHTRHKHTTDHKNAQHTARRQHEREQRE